MSLAIRDNRLVVDGRSIELEWPVLDAVEGKDRIFVLFDPDRCQCMPGERGPVLRPGPVFPKLIAIRKDGTLLWKAAYPQPENYYYNFSSTQPLAVNSFSSWRCEIDPDTGAMLFKLFFK